MKGERRSSRGQSVEFADYRNYSAGDDLRQLDWNVYARLERLFIKLFVEEEDVTVPASSTPRRHGLRRAEQAAFARRAAGALAYLGLAHLDRVSVASSVVGRAAAAAARQVPRLRGLPLPLRAAPERLTGLAAAARHAAARLRPRPADPDQRPDGPGADALRDLAGTRCQLSVLHVLSPDELDPPLEGDLRLVDNETGDGIDITGDLPTLDAYRQRLAEWKESFADLAARRQASYIDLSSATHLNDLIFAELRRRRVLA